MNKMIPLKNTLTKVTFMLALMIAILSCDQEKVLSADEYPNEVTSYVAKHFPNNAILQIVKDSDGMTKSYEVLLSENISLEFNRNKEVIDIDGKLKLPNSVIPENILQYVT